MKEIKLNRETDGRTPFNDTNNNINNSNADQDFGDECEGCAIDDEIDQADKHNPAGL